MTPDIPVTPAAGGFIATCVCGWERWSPTHPHVARAAAAHHTTHATKEQP